MKTVHLHVPFAMSPTKCGTMQRAHITTDESKVTCKLCLRKMGRLKGKQENGNPTLSLVDCICVVEAIDRCGPSTMVELDAEIPALSKPSIQKRLRYLNERGKLEESTRVERGRKMSTWSLK